MGQKYSNCRPFLTNTFYMDFMDLHLPNYLVISSLQHLKTNLLKNSRMGENMVKKMQSAFVENMSGKWNKQFSHGNKYHQRLLFLSSILFPSLFKDQNFFAVNLIHLTFDCVMCAPSPNQKSSAFLMLSMIAFSFSLVCLICFSAGNFNEVLQSRKHSYFAHMWFLPSLFQNPT